MHSLSSSLPNPIPPLPSFFSAQSLALWNHSTHANLFTVRPEASWEWIVMGALASFQNNYSHDNEMQEIRGNMHKIHHAGFNPEFQISPL